MRTRTARYWFVLPVTLAMGGAVPCGTASGQQPAPSDPPAQTGPPGQNDSSVGRLSGTVFFGTTTIRFAGAEPPIAAAAVDLTGRMDRRTQVTISLVRGARQDISQLFKYPVVETRLRMDVRRPAWNISMGETSAQSSAITGPSIQGQGAAIRWHRSRFLGDAMVARPKRIGEIGGGHLVRANAGVRVPLGVVSATISDLVRPARRSTISNTSLADLYTVSDVITEANSIHGEGTEKELTADQVHEIAKALIQANRIQGAGVESTLNLSGAHQLTVKAGGLSVANADEFRSHGATGEARYRFTAERGSLTARARRTPRSVSGVTIPGNEMVVNGALKTTPSFNFDGRAFTQSSSTLGQRYPSEAHGGSFGMLWGKKATADIRANYRTSHLVRTRVTRTITTEVTIPLGAVTIEGSGEFGDIKSGIQTARVKEYGAGLSTKGKNRTAFVNAGYQDSGLQQREVNVDAGASLMFGSWQWHGGVEFARGTFLGDYSRLWNGASLPLLRNLALVIGVERSRWTTPPGVWVDDLQNDASPWRATFGLQRKLTMPLAVPFRRKTPGQVSGNGR